MFRLKAAFSNSGHRLTLNDPSQIATLGLGARVLGILFRQVLEVRALFLGLGQNVFGLLLDFGNFGVGLAHGHEKNVLGMDAVGHLVLLNVLLVEGFEFVVGNGSVLAKLRKVQQAIADDALFRNLELGFVLVVIGFDFGVVRGDFGF